MDFKKAGKKFNYLDQVQQHVISSDHQNKQSHDCLRFDPKWAPTAM
jgi:hypothetical protein